ncbi:hypothetical protein Taro_045376 [Colocasia esculenta]|uniref:Peptidase A1 domain-containing protein n=1 Tax=Colocasia esculenta TaxID=4460 RepID=A0A843X447_COLES|nr:hypothetical protein [Colocasia esculenta]
MSRHRYRMARPVSTLDTCYLVNRPNFSYPAITLHFRGVDLPLGFLQVFYVVRRSLIRSSTYCLAFAAIEGVGNGDPVIGSIQQAGTEVIYDNAQHRIGFAPGVLRERDGTSPDNAGKGASVSALDRELRVEAPVEGPRGYCPLDRGARVVQPL